MIWPGAKHTPGFTGKENGQLKKIEQGWKKTFAANDKKREQKSAAFFARRETQRKDSNALTAGVREPRTTHSGLPVCSCPMCEGEPKSRRKAKDVALESKTRNNKG